MSSYSPALDLPGEHGVHRRDGSLIRKKREQWGREKEENSVWFPFGTPGGGAPNPLRRSQRGGANAAEPPSTASTSTGYGTTGTLPSSSDGSRPQSDARPSHQQQFAQQTPQGFRPQQDSPQYSVLNSTAFVHGPSAIASTSTPPVAAAYSSSAQYASPGAHPTYSGQGSANAHIEMVMQQQSLTAASTSTAYVGYPGTPPLVAYPVTSTGTSVLPPVNSPPANIDFTAYPFIYANSAYGHPIPIELVQGPNGQLIPKFPIAYSHHPPHGQLPSDPQHHQHHRGSGGGGEPAHASSGVGSPSYTEHWANQLPKWSSESSFEASKSSLPPIAPSSNPPSKPPREAASHYQRRPSNGSPAPLTRGQSLNGSQGELRRLQQLHDSTTSLNSSGHPPPTDGGSAWDEDEREREKSRRKALEAQHVLEQQIEEKRRMEARQAEAERRELEQIERERRILEERERKQAEDENNRWKKRQDVADSHERSLLEAIEEARREAEALKKMKLYKHVLQSPDCSPDVAKKILGTDDDRLANHVMRQVNEFERQKRLEREMQHNSPTGSARDSPRSARPPHGTPPDQGRAKSLPPKSPATPQTPPDATSKPPLVSSNSVTERSSPTISRNGFGRSSVRTPSAKKPVVPLRRSGSGERTYTPAATTRRSPQRRASPEKKPPTPVVPADPTNGRVSDSHPSPPVPRTAASSQRKPSPQKRTPPVPAPRQRSLSSATMNCRSLADKAIMTTPPQSPPPHEEQEEELVIEDNGDDLYLYHRRPVPVPPPAPSPAAHLAMRYLADLPTENDLAKENRPRHVFASGGPAGLFAPVRTRSKMRQQAVDMDPPIATKTTSTSSDSACSSQSSPSPPLSAGYDSSSHSEQNSLSHPVPIITENGRELSEDLNGNLKTPLKARSNVLGQNLLGESEDEQKTPAKPPASPFLRKLAERGSKRNIDNYAHLTPDASRLHARSPSLMRLQGSMQNLSMTENGNGGDSQPGSRCTTPKPFNCRTAQHNRSLNLKQNTERQRQILEQLAQLRANLKDKQAKMERTLSSQNLARSATTGSMAATAANFNGGNGNH